MIARIARSLILSAPAILLPASALAQGGVPVPIRGTAITLPDIVYLVQRVMNIGIVLATLIIVAMIIYAGFKMATSRGNETEYGKAKDILKYAIYGGLVVFGVGLIVNTIANVAYNPANVLY